MPLGGRCRNGGGAGRDGGVRVVEGATFTPPLSTLARPPPLVSAFSMDLMTPIGCLNKRLLVSSL